MSLIPPVKSRSTHHPTLVNLKQGPRNLDLFNEFRSAPSLEFRNVNENVFLFLNAAEVHVFCRVWQELRMGVIPEQIISMSCENTVGLVVRTNRPHLLTGGSCKSPSSWSQNTVRLPT